MKKSIKILSVILATIMFFSVFSAANPVFAVELQQAEMNEETQEQSAESEISEGEAEEAPADIEVLKDQSGDGSMIDG